MTHATEGLYVLAAGGRWDGVRFGAHSIAEQLVRYGRVLFVDPPSSVQAARTTRNRLEQLGDRLYRLRPVVPPGRRLWPVRQTAELLVRRAVRRAVERLGGPVEAVVAFSPQLDLFGFCGERAAVYWAKDDVTAGAELMDLPPRRLAAAEAARASAADLLVAGSAEIGRRWRAKGFDPLVLPNGVDHAHFAHASRLPVPADVTLPGPRAGFVGHLSHRIDVATLHAVASAGVSLLLVGPVQRTFDEGFLAPLLERPNVQWIGQRSYEELPAYIGAMRVGLLPYTDSEFNRASFPLKVLQHLAAGRAVVAADLPAVRWLDTPLVDVASSPEAFAGTVVRRLAEGHDSEAAAARSAFAAGHDWSRRVDAFVEALAR